VTASAEPEEPAAPAPRESSGGRGADDVVLVGMMGTGKSTVGRLLAGRTGRPLLDSDELIELRTGRTVRELWADHGEPGYRELESAALRDAIGTTPGGAVIAAAGGVVLREENRRLLRESGVFVVWLRARPEVLYQRVRASIDGGHRPLLDDDPLGTLARLDAERAPLYAEVADAILDVEHLTPGRAADLIASARPDRPTPGSRGASTASGPQDTGGTE
jgi:shikimate kinase